MKKIINIFMAVVVLGSYWLSAPTLSFAASSQSAALQESNFIAFSELGITDELLLGPISDFQVVFGIPSSWTLTPAGSVLLNIEVASTLTGVQDSSTAGADDEFTGATMEVSFNDVSLGVIALKKGLQTLALDIPAAALISPRLDERHELLLIFNAEVDCIYPQETTVLVRATSGFELPHSVGSPSLDLNKLPRPIYQQDSIHPEPLVIVVPDQPTPQEIQAGLTVAAGFGRLTLGNQSLLMRPLSGLTEVERASSHLIFVGKSGSLPVLESVNFPATISGSSIAFDGLDASDGVVQMAVSPWNTALSVIYVGGENDDAVVKSALALGTGQLRAGLRPDFTVIRQVSSAVEIPSVDTDRTLESLGYESLEVSGIGFQSLEYNFYIPFGQVAGQDSYFDLVYTHSALMDFLGSGLIVSLNDQIIGSLRVTEESARGINTARIPIPAYAAHPGFNTLKIETEFIPLNICSELNRDGLWLNVHNTSLLHIPLMSAPVTTINPTRDLSQYPALFNLDPTLGNLAFVVPANDPQSWNIAAQLASFLGQNATGSILNPAVTFGDSIPDEIRQARDLIIVGRATQLPILTDLGDSLPAPFKDGSDLADESGMLVSYLIPEGTSIGYLQLLPAPWDVNRTILAVMGSTPAGLDWSGNALITPDLIRLLRGTFAVVTDTEIRTADTNVGLGTQNLSATAVPGDYETVDAQTQDVPVTDGYQRNELLIAISVVSLLTVLFLVFLILQSRRKKSD